MRSDPWDRQGRTAVSNGASMDYLAGNNDGRTSFEPSFLERSVDYLVERYVPSPWSQPAASHERLPHRSAAQRRPLYKDDERVRRDSTVWTLVQGLLAPLQFLVFLVSLALVLNYMGTGRGYEIATASVILKTLVLYAIMVTGAIWEKVVFGKYLFAPAFFWEDMVSMLVIALHTAYLLAVWAGWGSANDRMVLALVAYGTYAVNAGQFLLKFRAARLESVGPSHYPQGHAT